MRGNGWLVLPVFVMFLASLAAAGSLEDLARPHDGHSRRETSTARLPNGDFDPNSNVAGGVCPVALY